ncbi:CcmD family protein [candidate division KSB1 bacterium]|nr:CcmD family protein [candidate division KSB1 bacterium]
MQPLHFLFAAYTIIWVCLLLFLLKLALKISALEKKVILLQEK